MDVDLGKFTASIKQLAKAVDDGDYKAALKVGFEVLRLSQMEVAHDKGFLQNSGAVDVIEGQIYVGYHTPYAARLHEHPEYNFQKGRKGKYLSDPIVRNQGALGLVFGKEFGDNISNG